MDMVYSGPKYSSLLTKKKEPFFLKNIVDLIAESLSIATKLF